MEEYVRRYEATVKRNKQLDLWCWAVGGKLHTKWACEFESERRACPCRACSPAHTPFMCNWLGMLLAPRIDVQSSGLIQDREVMKGGRTEALAAYTMEAEDLALYTVDRVSAYPAVMASNPLLIGHPDYITGFDAEDRKELLQSQLDCAERQPHHIFGFVRALIQPNPDDIVGFLPFRISERMVGKIFNGQKLGREDVGRLVSPVGDPFLDVFFSEELRLAVHYGKYKLLHVYEIISFPPETIRDDLFKGLISMYYRDKCECEGWRKLKLPGMQFAEEPSLEQQQEIVDFFESSHNGLFRLRPDFVKKDEAKRSLAKLKMNSTFGKYGERVRAEVSKKVDNHHLDQEFFNAA